MHINKSLESHCITKSFKKVQKIVSLFQISILQVWLDFCTHYTAYPFFDSISRNWENNNKIAWLNCLEKLPASFCQNIYKEGKDYIIQEKGRLPVPALPLPLGNLIHGQLLCHSLETFWKQWGEESWGKGEACCMIYQETTSMFSLMPFILWTFASSTTL